MSDEKKSALSASVAKTSGQSGVTAPDDEHTLPARGPEEAGTFPRPSDARPVCPNCLVIKGIHDLSCVCLCHVIAPLPGNASTLEGSAVRALQKLVSLWDEFAEEIDVDFGMHLVEHIDHWRALVNKIPRSNDALLKPTGTVARGSAGTVTVVDVAGDNTGPWKLFVGEHGVAQWPSAPAYEDPKEYALSVARAILRALADDEHGPQRTNEPLHPDQPRVLKLLVQRVGGRASMTEHDLQRADRFQLRWNNNGHVTEVLAVDDT